MNDKNSNKVALHGCVTFDYVNWKGKDTKRSVSVISVYYGVLAPHYMNSTWLVECYCHEKKAIRTFELMKIRNIKVKT